ncbi:LysR family transcriptional regulator [Rhodoplanes sp. SY1]|uniref:LysR family transcriptional regulator n=1 Tax=Rhodoplanes sp. SY1 TaxID=3166646 RepID=UPI0038B516C3
MRIHSAAIVYFDAVRRAGSIREAARRLNVASSAVNRQILKLEAEIGAPLFERLPAGLKLTAAGEAIARHALVVLQDLERARSDIEGLRGARAGHVKISTVEGVCGALLPEVIGTLRARAPRVTVAVSTMGSFAIPDAIAAGDADVGVAFALRRSPELRQVAVSRFKLGAIMPPGHPLAGRKTVSLAACLDHPIILATPDLSINQLLGPALARLPRSFEPSVTASSIELMRELAERGAGIAFQTRVGLERQLDEGRLVHVPLDSGGPVWSDLGVYVRAGRSLPAVLDVFLQILAAALADREQLENARD